MTFKELEFFYHLSQSEHVLQSAKSLHVSQSAISLAIKSLEKKLGEQLFDRVGKKLVLNEKGKLFYKQTYEYFIKLKEAEKLFQEDKIQGIIKCACSKTIGGFVMPSIFYKFIQEYPKIEVQKELKNSTMIVEALKKGELDIGFVESEFEDDDIIKEKLCDDELIVISSDKNMKGEFYIDTLLDKEWILRESGSGTKEVFLAALGRLVKDLHVSMEYQDFEEIKSLLYSHKEIITCVSKHVVKQELDTQKFVHVRLKNMEIKRKFYCVYHKK